MTAIRRTPWWVWVACLVPLGLGAWAPLAPSVQRRKPVWALFTTLSLALVIAALFVPTGPDGDNSLKGALVIAGWVGAIATSLSIRRPYLEGTNPSGWETRKARAAERLRVRREAIALVASDPALAAELGVGRPDVRGAQHAGLIDVNHASAAAIAGLPGFDAALAARVVQLRGELNGFDSVVDLGLVADLDANHVERLRERTVFLPR